MYRSVANVCGYFILVLSVMMLFPMLADLAAGHPDWQAFFIASMATGLGSALLILSTQGERPHFNLRFGFLLVNLVWWSTSFVGALPLLLSAEGISLTDAVFEAASGITSTGGTVLTGLDEMPPGLLLWRSMMQWFGGLGIVAMALLILPFLRVGGMQIYRLESSTQTDNPFTKFAELTRALLGFYVVLSGACALAYMFVGVDVFDALNLAMTTVSTGGFSTSDTSMGKFGEGALVVSILFMIAGALPFIVLLRVFATGRITSAYDIQIPVLLGILAVLSFLVWIAVMGHTGGEPLPLLLHSVFNVVSVVTTTGFASADYTEWGPLAAALFLVATFMGGAAGSTSGGIKTYRLIILFLSLRNALKELVYPHGVFVVRYDGREVPAQAMRSIALFIYAFMGLLFVITVILAATGLDLVTSFSGALSALTNVGPALGDIIGPAGNFSSLDPVAKWALIFGMVAGRLEILSVLVLLSPTFWRQ